MLERCLQLLSFSDEIVVVVDSRSDDRTEEIARRHTDRVWVEEFQDFAQHKNNAIAKARGDWVLIVDADERITPALAAEIDRVLSSDPFEWAFRIDTINFFLGRRMDHGGWKEDHVRLIRRERATYAGAIHEWFTIPPERLGKLEHGMWHFSHRSIQENLAKTVRFGDVQAAEMLAAGAAPMTPWRLLRIMVREWVSRVIVKRGYRDGMEGFIEGTYQPISLFCVYVMLWQRQRSESLWDTYQALERAAAEER
jgi:(heptosyl)LPS beta-1,4-glucosyltransferase